MISSLNSEININIPLSVLRDLDKALNKSTNILSDNAKALTKLKTDHHKLLSLMIEIETDRDNLLKQNVNLANQRDLDKALNKSTNILSDNTKALTKLKTDHDKLLSVMIDINTDRDNLLKQNDKLSKQMKEMKNEIEDLKQKLTIHSCMARKRKLNENQSSQLYEKKAKTHVNCDVNFNSLPNDMLSDILQFVGRRCYGSFGLINRTCNKIYTKNAMAKETFIFGYAKLSMIRFRRFDHANYDNLAIGVVKYNRVDILGYLLRRSNGEKLSHVCQIAALEGRFDILKEIFDNVNYVVLKYLYECPEICEKAAEGNHEQILKWLREQGSCWNEEAFYAVAGHGELDLLEWMIAKDPDRFYDPEDRPDESEEDHNDNCMRLSDLCENALRSNNIEMCEWLEARGIGYWDEYMVYSVAERGQLDMLKWLINQQNVELSDSEELFDSAVQGGSLEVVKFLKDEGYRWLEDDMCGLAAFSGHLDLLIWLRDQGCTLNTKTFSDAAGGYATLEILEWLKENKCPWDENAFKEAHRGDNKLVVKWLRENGCPLTFVYTR